MSGFVLDASVAATWCFADETTPESDALRDSLAELNPCCLGYGTRKPRTWVAKRQLRAFARSGDPIRYL